MYPNAQYTAQSAKHYVGNIRETSESQVSSSLINIYQYSSKEIFLNIYPHIFIFTSRVVRL